MRASTNRYTEPPQPRQPRWSNPTSRGPGGGFVAFARCCDAHSTGGSPRHARGILAACHAQTTEAIAICGAGPDTWIMSLSKSSLIIDNRTVLTLIGSDFLRSNCNSLPVAVTVSHDAKHKLRTPDSVEASGVSGRARQPPAEAARAVDFAWFVASGATAARIGTPATPSPGD